jgi:hypothetical protein
MYVTGGTGVAGNATFQYDTNDMEWTQLPDLPDNYLAPATVAYGGLLVMLGGQGSFGRSDEVLFMVRTKNDREVWHELHTWAASHFVPCAFPIVPQSTTNSSGGWQVAPLSGTSFGVRNGHRAMTLGGLLFVLGGWDGTTYFNDLWGLDLASLLLASSQLDGAAPSWVQLLPNGAQGMISARSSFSWDAVGGATFVFGGSESSEVS